MRAAALLPREACKVGAGAQGEGGAGDTENPDGDLPETGSTRGCSAN